MKEFVLNIGLNVGYIEPRIQEDSTLFHVEQLFGNMVTEIVDNNSGDWGKERVCKVYGKTKLDLITFLKELQKLAQNLKQDAIAFKYDGYGHIVFNRNYKGEFYEFNQDYFIN